MLGRFVAPAARARELAENMQSARGPLRTSFVIDRVARIAELAAFAARAPDAVATETLECRFTSLPGGTADERLSALFDATVAAGFATTTPVYVEVDAAEAVALSRALAAILRARERGYQACAKLRCGGPAAAATPSPGAVATFIWEANRLRVPFKATAGLHHPIRAFNQAAGYAMHGFLNVIGAAVLTRARGLDRTTVERIVAEEDRSAFELGERRFAWAGIGADAEEIGEARGALVHGFGSCSFDEPVEDLCALGILSNPVPAGGEDA